MKSTIKYFSRIFFGESNENSLERRIFLTASLITLLGAALGIIWDLFLGMPRMLTLIVGIFILLYFLLYFNARFKNKYSLLAYFIISLLFLNLLYIFNGGLNGSIPSLFIVFILVFITISNKKNQLFILIITTADLLGLFVVERFFLKDLISPYINNETREMDLAFGYIAALILCFIIINYFKKSIISKNNQLQSLNKSKDLLFNIIAHDLRAPFNGILGFAGLMSDKSENLRKDELQEYAELINIQSQKTFELLESLLEWGRIQTNKIKLNPQSINLYQVVNEIIDYFNENHTINEHEIKVEVPSDIFVIADMVILKTIFRNLISNALKFTPAKEEIKISVEKFNTKHIAIIIKDKGIGMNKEMMENLFNFEINTNRNGVNGESSVGLGLVITKELIEKQGGKLIIESEENIGSTFKFTVQKS